MSDFNAKAYAAAPGTGPANETCGSCNHLWSQRRKHGRVFKCYLLVDRWTFDKSTDVKQLSPACERWLIADNKEIK